MLKTLNTISCHLLSWAIFTIWKQKYFMLATLWGKKPWFHITRFSLRVILTWNFLLLGGLQILKNDWAKAVQMNAKTSQEQRNLMALWVHLIRYLPSQCHIFHTHRKYNYDNKKQEGKVFGNWYELCIKT